MVTTLLKIYNSKLSSFNDHLFTKKSHDITSQFVFSNCDMKITEMYDISLGFFLNLFLFKVYMYFNLDVHILCE